MITFALVVSLALGQRLPPEMQKIHDDPKLQAKLCAALVGEGHQESDAAAPATFSDDDPKAAGPVVITPEGFPDQMSALLHDAREPPLGREGYRVTLEYAFVGHMVVRVNVHDEHATLVAKVWPVTPKVVPLCRRVERQLTSAELQHLRTCFTQRAPWIRPHAMVTDGNEWWLEANDAEGYRRERETVPSAKSPLRRCGTLLTNFSGLKFVPLDLPR